MILGWGCSASSKMQQRRAQGAKIVPKETKFSMGKNN